MRYFWLKPKTVIKSGCLISEIKNKVKSYREKNGTDYNGNEYKTLLFTSLKTNVIRKNDKSG